jgi:hypothetical protein
MRDGHTPILWRLEDISRQWNASPQLEDQIQGDLVLPGSILEKPATETQNEMRDMSCQSQ